MLAPGKRRFGAHVFHAVLLVSALAVGTPARAEMPPRRAALLQMKGELLTQIQSYEAEQSKARGTVARAQLVKTAAEKQGDTRNAELAAQAISVAEEAIANAERFKAENQQRVAAIDRGLSWLDTESSGKPFAIPLLVRGEVFKNNVGGRVRFEGTKPLHLGDQIETGLDSTVEVQFEDGTQLNLGPTSTFTYEPENGGLWYKLLKGRLRSRRGPSGFPVRASNEPRYKTHAYIIAVRGTDFALESGEARAVIWVFDGAVEIDPGSGRAKILVKAGETLILPNTGVPGRPVPLDEKTVNRWWE